MLDLERLELLHGEQRGALLTIVPISGEKGGAVRTHVPCDVGAVDVLAREHLERTQDGVVQERPALDDDVFTDLLGVTDLDDLEQRVLHDGVGQPGGDIPYCRAFLLRLLDARVHENGAPRTEVHGCLGGERHFGELLNRHAHGIGERLEERTAPRGARFVQHDVIDDPVVDAQALHVLTTHVEDELDLGKHRTSAAEVRHCLDLTGISTQTRQEQAFAIAGHGGVTQLAPFRDDRVEFLQHRARRSEHVTAVLPVHGVEQLTVLTHERSLHGRGASVDTDVHATTVVGDVTFRYDLLLMACHELLVLLGRGEERIEPLDFGALRITERIQTGEKV